jgi:hypothetical protein
MSTRLTIRDVWRIDKRPASRTDVRSSVLVGMAGEPALPTLECSLVGPVLFRGVAALKALARSIARINDYHGNTLALRFISDKRPQLSESPGMENAAHTSPNRGPQANVRQIFQRNSPLRVFSERDDLLTNSMIRVATESCFLAGKLLQPTLTRLRAFLLQTLSQPFVTMPDTLDVSTRIAPSIRVRQDIFDAEIAAQKILDLSGVRVVNIARAGQVKGLSVQNQVRFALLKAEQLFLLFSVNKGDLQPSAGCPDRYQVLADIPIQQPQVIGNRSVQPKDSLGFFIQGIRLRHLGNATDNALRVQLRELSTGASVGDFVKFELSKGFRFPRLFRKPIATAVRFAQGILKGRKRTLVCFELYFGSKLHKHIISSMETINKAGNPPLKQWVSCRKLMKT